MSAALPSTRRLPDDVVAASELLSALAAPLRLSIVALLDEHGTRCVHELVDALGVPQPLVSQHLRVLRAARLVVGDRQHREVHYRLTDSHVGHIVRDAIEHAAHSAVPAADPTLDQGPDAEHHETAGTARATIA
ncbi:winged helix-turn-helix transcriptional regulator [Geodermatophilaceae bacterium NBWT11]|nr:winged helix-turn-helix transcriptional regulator [Geodermatophilaceae bacterium NBWT11]